MENQVTNNANALRLFFTDDVFLVEDKNLKMPLFANTEGVSAPEMTTADIINRQPDVSISTPISSSKDNNNPNNYLPPEDAPLILAEPEAPVSFKFLGGNKKSVLILVNDKMNDVSTAQGRELLRKIVKAVNLSTPDFALVNYANCMGSDFVALHQFFKPVIMLSFGVEIPQLKLNLNWQNEIIVHETTKIIFAPNLHDLDGDIAAKKLLWANLQKINN